MLSIPIILASQSPRRQELMRGMDLNFRVEIREVDESFPEGLSPQETAVYIAEKKAIAFDSDSDDHLVVTADTIVCIEGDILGKPRDVEDAQRMLRLLSGKEHEVITGMCLLYQHRKISFFDTTKVLFSELSDAEINYYIESYKPFDKAGAYGIQEWIGLTAVRSIKGSYTNVVGLPTEKFYGHLLEM